MKKHTEGRDKRFSFKEYTSNKGNEEKISEPRCRHQKNQLPIVFSYEFINKNCIPEIFQTWIQMITKEIEREGNGVKEKFV